MASILRQIVAGPRARHEETGLDLCYVTSEIIATSGPSQTYPRLAYRNPLHRLVAFLDEQHGDGWAIWEFRAEGTGYPDDAVYGRIRHYPWPDHHPPPFRIVPLIVASMRNWLAGQDISGSDKAAAATTTTKEAAQPPDRRKKDKEASVGGPPIQDRDTAAEAEAEAQQTSKEAVKGGRKGDRVVVVHCKAGKGRSGTAACSFLISERGWTPEAAMARFTERRMRPKFGAGLSIPSQLRWITYVDRWTRGGKHYVERAVEIVEIHMWKLRSGVKVSVEGFADEGRRIEVVHTFSAEERVVIEGDAPSPKVVGEIVPGVAKLAAAVATQGVVGEEADYVDIKEGGKASFTSGLIRKISHRSGKSPAAGLRGKSSTTNDTATVRTADAAQSATESSPSSSAVPISSSKTAPISSAPPPQQQLPTNYAAFTDKKEKAKDKEPSVMAVIFKPRERLMLSNSDVNIAIERRNRAPASMGLTMVTAVAHVWFNIFFEGRGPEQGGRADDSGVFEIDWDRMDGIKGSSQKGTRAIDRLAVVWRAVDVDGGVAASSSAGDEAAANKMRKKQPDGGDVEGTGTGTGGLPGEIREPGEGEDVPQMQAADWKGGNREDPEAPKRLGLRVADPDSAGVSRASSVRSQGQREKPPLDGPGEDDDQREARDESDSDSLQGVKSSGPGGEELAVAPAREEKEEEEEARGQVTGRRGEAESGGGGSGGDDVADATAQKGFIVE